MREVYIMIDDDHEVFSWILADETREDEEHRYFYDGGVQVQQMPIDTNWVRIPLNVLAGIGNYIGDSPSKRG